MFLFTYRQDALCDATRTTKIIVIGIDITDEYWISVGATKNLRPFAKCDWNFEWYHASWWGKYFNDWVSWFHEKNETPKSTQYSVEFTENKNVKATFY